MILGDLMTLIARRVVDTDNLKLNPLRTSQRIQTPLHELLAVIGKHHHRNAGERTRSTVTIALRSALLFRL